MRVKNVWLARDGYEKVSHELCSRKPNFKRMPPPDSEFYEGGENGPSVLTVMNGGTRMSIGDKAVQALFGIEPLEVGEVRAVAIYIHDTDDLEGSIE